MRLRGARDASGDGPSGRFVFYSRLSLRGGPVAFEVDGVTAFTQEEVDAMIAEQTAGLKSKADELLSEAKRAKNALRDYDGVDPKEFKRLKEAAEQAERAKAAADGDFKALEKQLVERHTVELSGRDTKITKLSKALERRLIDAELIRAITEKKGEPDLLLPYARQFVRVREVDDDFEGYVSDERGNPMVSDGKGTPMDFGSFVEQRLMTKFPRAFDGTGSSGGGASRTAASGGGGQHKTVSASDHGAFISNLAAIATGKVEVTE